MHSKITLYGDGSTVSFPFTFTLGYSDISQISVRVGEEVDGTGNPVYRPFTAVDSHIIIGGDVPADGVAIEVARTVSKETTPVTFVDAGSFTASNMNDMQKGLMYAVHEAMDAEEEAQSTVQDMRGILQEAQIVRDDAEEIAVTIAADSASANVAATEAAASESAASLSAINAATSASEANTSASIAVSSASAAAASESAAASSELLASLWASAPYDTEVSGGMFSALHYAAKAQDIAAMLEGNVGVVSIGGFQGIVTLEQLNLDNVENVSLSSVLEDYYTSNEVDTLASNYYTKAQIDAAGYISGDISHSTLTNLGNDDHPQYLKTDANAVSAAKLETARAISISGAVVGSVNFDGTTNVDIVTTAAAAVPNVGEIGSMVIAASTSAVNAVRAIGYTVAGSTLYVSSESTYAGGLSSAGGMANAENVAYSTIKVSLGLTGTWRNLSRTVSSESVYYPVSLWQRIA